MEEDVLARRSSLITLRPASRSAKRAGNEKPQVLAALLDPTMRRPRARAPAQAHRLHSGSSGIAPQAPDRLAARSADAGESRDLVVVDVSPDTPTAPISSSASS